MRNREPAITEWAHDPHVFPDVLPADGYAAFQLNFQRLAGHHVVREKIVEHSDTSVIRRVARERGMTELVEDGLRHIVAGKTTIEEVLSVAHAEEEIIS